MDHEPHSHNKFVSMKSQRVKVDDSFAPAFDDETESVEHLLAEPKSEYVTIDGVLCFGKENTGKCLNMEDFSRGCDFGLNTYSGGLHSAHPRGRNDEFEFGVLDGLLDEVDEVEDIDAINGLPSPCDDYLLDIGFIGKAPELDFGPVSHLGNSSSESPSPGLSGSSNSAVGISESSSVTIQELEFKNNSIDKAVTHKFHGDFRRKKRSRKLFVGKVFPASTNIKNLDEFDNDEKPIVSRILPGDNVRGSVETIKIGAFRKEKRLHKPTRRFIEEFSGNKSKDSKGTEDQRSKVSSQNEHRTRLRRMSSVPEGDSISENQTLAEFKALRKRAKKYASLLELESDEQPITSESDDDYVPTERSTNDRRKHQHIWTPSEVMTLVDGISEYGVGRWTDIKRALFSSSDYRTPIDLRDKWRNILRNSCEEKLQNEVEEKEIRALPKSLMHRVRELATAHPYPRQRGKKHAPPILPTPSKSESSDRIIKYARRKRHYWS